MKITVFTPTFNRAYTLPKLYNSLTLQTFHDFEWLVIDDGSTDNTQALIHNYIAEKKVTTRYYKVQNGGKHRAINKGSDLAEGRIFFPVDSDDQLTPDALEKINSWFDEIDATGGKFAGVAGLKGFTNHVPVGTTFKGEKIDLLSPEQRKYGLSGDKAEAFYTSVLRANKFPEFEGENFLTEAVLWFKIAEKGYKTRYYNQIIYTCEYLPDGLSQNSFAIRLRNIHGTLFAYHYLMNLKLLPYSLRLRYFLNYCRFFVHNQLGI